MMGDLKSLQWTISTIGQKFDIKSQILGPEPQCEKEVRILNRTIRWTPAGIEYEPDAKHARMVIEDLHLKFSKKAH